jgi:Cu-processing system permease protein
MRQMMTVARQAARELMRGWWVASYGLFFMLLAWALFAFGERPAQAVVSVLDLVLLVIPFVSIVVGVLSFYNSREFAELLLAQPVARSTVFFGQYLGLSVSLAAAFTVGLGAPFAWYGWSTRDQAGTLLVLLLAGIFLTFIFVAFAFAIAVRTENRLKALGAAIFLWLFLALVYDGLLLAVIMAFSAYPLEKPLLGLCVLNPLDVARILILLRLDVAALMGYTGAVFKQFFGSTLGLGLAGACLAAWVALPVLAGVNAYARRDF